MPQASSAAFRVEDEGEVTLTADAEGLTVRYTGAGTHALFAAVQFPEQDSPGEYGSNIVPYSRGLEGSTVFLPFPAQRIYSSADGRCRCRVRKALAWSELSEGCPDALMRRLATGVEMHFTWPPGNQSKTANLAVYVKDMKQNDGWGTLLGSCDPSTSPGWGDKVIGRFYQVSGPSIVLRHRLFAQSRERIYELFVRLFGNKNDYRKRDGTLAENGCGKFADISPAALARIAGMGFTHIWLMGVVRHATTTGYGLPGLEADKTDLMKGLAGSPYAIKDYFDVAPDLATEPARRTEEFRELTDRIHAAGLKVLVDFVGNHVSRAYDSHARPDITFGSNDNRSLFFDANNNFFYLSARDAGDGPPLRLPTFDRDRHLSISPTCIVRGDCDGLFEPEARFGRVTGNNSITWSPGMNDWYETVKLNYGFEFTGRFQPQRQFPHSQAATLAVPDTWLKMDAALGYWQGEGVDGFRCDMAHMMPPEFWCWSIGRARRRNPAVFFMAEAYNDYFAVRTTAPEVPALGGDPLFQGLLHAGFNAVYGHDAYRIIKGIYDGGQWANDLDGVLGSEFVMGNSVHYAENHDEVRLASPYAWGGTGLSVGRPAAAVLFGLGRGPVLFYNGQEIGEPAVEAEGFSGADGRTTLFDYWSMPEFSKWVNGGLFDGAALSAEQQKLRHFYSRLVQLSGSDVFHHGKFLGLNQINRENHAYGRFGDETVSGHWLYSFLRFDPASGERMLITANFHDSFTMTNVRIFLTDAAMSFLNADSIDGFIFTDRLAEEALPLRQEAGQQSIVIPAIPPLMACYFSMEESRS